MKNKTTTTLLCLFFGLIGVHQLYLGNSLKFIFYIIGWITLGIIPAFACLYDLFFFALMSEEKFNLKYNG